MRFYYSIAFTSKVDRSVYSFIQQYGIKGFITSYQWSIKLTYTFEYLFT